jgi:hypothetical protein
LLSQADQNSLYGQQNGASSGQSAVDEQTVFPDSHSSELTHAVYRSPESTQHTSLGSQSSSPLHETTHPSQVESQDNTVSIPFQCSQQSQMSEHGSSEQLTPTSPHVPELQLVVSAHAVSQSPQ